MVNRAGKIVGAEYVEAAAGLCSAAPRDAQQAADLLRFANENRLAVCAQGSGTKISWLNLGPAQLLLRTHRMSALREHTWQDMTCTVEAGSTWHAMQATLAEHGQQVALDPLWPERATVGGVVASNDSGALRLRYGGLRDLVIGMTIALADGTVARSGGKVVKNVAGYDLPKLLCGSFGTLALITEVTFRLHSIAPHAATITVVAPTAEPLGALLLRVLESHFGAQSIQLRTAAHGFALDVRLSALPEVLEMQVASLLELAMSMGLPAELAPAGVWAAREDLFSSATSTFKATMLPTGIAPAVQSVHDLGGSAVAQASGILTGSLPTRLPLDRLAPLRAQIEATGGSLTLLQTTSEDTFDRWGTLPGSLTLMQSVKQQFDPNRVLNPGRFLGSL